MYFKTLFCTLLTAFVVVGAAHLEARQTTLGAGGQITSIIGSVIDSDVNAATSAVGSALSGAVGDVTSAVGDVTSAVGAATSAVGAVFTSIESEGGVAFTVISAEGGAIFTLAAKGAGEVVTTLGSVYTIAVASAHGSAAPSSAAAALTPQYPVQLTVALFATLASTLFGAYLIF